MQGSGDTALRGRGGYRNKAVAPKIMRIAMYHSTKEDLCDRRDDRATNKPQAVHRYS